FFKEVDDYFQTLRGPNGKDLGLKFLDGGRVLGARSYSKNLREVLEQDMLIRAVNSSGKAGATSSVVAAVPQRNPYQGIEFIAAPEISSTTYLYCFASNVPGLYPFVVQQSSLNEVRFDKDSEHWKRTGKVAISYDGASNAAGALPHPILRVEVTG